LPTNFNNTGYKMPSFDSELEELINKHGIDNDCGVPDYILASFMIQSLEPLQNMVILYDRHLQVAEDQYTTLTKGTKKEIMEPPVNIDD